MGLQIDVQSITKGNSVDMNMKKVRKEPSLFSCWTLTRVFLPPLEGHTRAHLYKSNTDWRVMAGMTHVRHVIQPLQDHFENRVICGSAHESVLTTVTES